MIRDLSNHLDACHDESSQENVYRIIFHNFAHPFLTMKMKMAFYFNFNSCILK